MLFYVFGSHAADNESLVIGFLLYNAIAFGLQPFIGYFCDIKKLIPIALIGCFILVAGLLLFFLPWASLVICAAGNACFHVGGGIDSLVNAGGRMWRSGVFVSSGAIGVMLGTLTGKSGYLSLVLPVILLIISITSMIFFKRIENKYENMHYANKTGLRFNITSKGKPISLILILCFSAVLIRSYAGSIIPVGWKTTTALTLLPAFGAFVGKAAGGFLADWFGAKNVGFLSLAASVPLLYFGYNDPVLCTTGILLFNMTMPITLCAIGDMLPRTPGFAFGLTTLWLLCGSIPTFFFAVPYELVTTILSILILVSAICIFVSTNNKTGVCKRDKIAEEV